MTLSFITAILFVRPSFSESLQLKDNTKIILQKNQPQQSQQPQQGKTTTTPAVQTKQSPKQNPHTAKQIFKSKKPAQPDWNKQGSTWKVKQKPRQAEQFQGGNELWEQETQNWEQETYDGVNGVPAVERAPWAIPGTEPTPGIGTQPTAELPPGSMPQINTEVEMEQDYSNVTGYTQPNFTVKEIDYENGVLKIVIINSGRLVNRSPCPQLAIEFGVHGINNTERRYITQCIDRERVITCNFAINWQETDGRKVCWVKIDPDNAVEELFKSDNNFEAPIYRSKAPIVRMIGGEVEFVESGKKYRKSDNVSIVREDVSDSIKEHRIFAVKLKYDLINYGAEAISFTSKLKCGDAEVYSSDQTAQSVRLKPGERKTIYHPVWLYTNNCVSMFRVQAYTLQAPLFNDVWALITCSESLIEWLGGYNPNVVILSNTFPSRIKINERANISLTIANYGGDLFSTEKWDLNVDIIKNNTNEAVFHWEWSNLTTPEGNHCCAGGYGSFTKNVHFTPTSTGYYTYRVRGTSSRGQIFEAGSCEHGKKPIGQKETEKTVSFQVFN